MSHHRLSTSEIRLLEETARADTTNGSIRLREGEYQFSLVKGIASFQLELMFPDVKDLIRRLYGEEHTGDLQFVRKIQTILKKMEKGNIVKILPKKNPWQLQRYGISSFRFLDSDKNMVVLATDQEIKQMLDGLHTAMSRQEQTQWKLLRTVALAIVMLASFGAAAFALYQNVVNPIIFVPAFVVSLLCAVLLGKAINRQ